MLMWTQENQKAPALHKELQVIPEKKKLENHALLNYITYF